MRTSPMKSVLPQYNGGWHTPEVARAQRELVEKELLADALGHPIAPMREFRKVLEWLSKNLETPFSLLDVGCGAGHYGVLCDRYASGIIYCGADSSQAMIDEARALAYQYSTGGELPVMFFVNDWSQNDYSQYDVILVSQIAEMTDDPPAVIEFILAQARRFIILHRLRTGYYSHRVYEKTYRGYDGQNWVWDLVWLRELIQKHNARIQYEAHWDDHATLIVEKQL